jgi:hypothetical protein
MLPNLENGPRQALIPIHSVKICNSLCVAPHFLCNPLFPSLPPSPLSPSVRERACACASPLVAPMRTLLSFLPNLSPPSFPPPPEGPKTNCSSSGEEVASKAYHKRYQIQNSSLRLQGEKTGADVHSQSPILRETGLLRPLLSGYQRALRDEVSLNYGDP